jgi:hypothetical protein
MQQKKKKNKDETGRNACKQPCEPIAWSSQSSSDDIVCAMCYPLRMHMLVSAKYCGKWEKRKGKKPFYVN